MRAEGEGPGPALDRHAHLPGELQVAAGRPGLRRCVPPPIQGIGNAGGFQMQVELRDGSFDYVKLQNATDNVIEQAQHAVGARATSSRPSAPARRTSQVDVDRAKAETLKVSVGDVFTTLSSYLGSTYVNHFNKFGLTLQVYVQADSQYRTAARRYPEPAGAQADGQMVPIGALATLSAGARAAADQPLQSLSVGRDRRRAGAGLQLRRGASTLMEQIANATLPPGIGYEWTAMSYQENDRRQPALYVFALAVLLVYLCLAGQYESWIAPLAVILGGAAGAARAGHRADQPRPRQQSLHPDRPDAADRARRQERHPDRRGRARAPHGRGQADRRGRGRSRRARASGRS